MGRSAASAIASGFGTRISFEVRFSEFGSKHPAAMCHSDQAVREGEVRGAYPFAPAVMTT
jgi:hypothetical protein